MEQKVEEEAESLDSYFTFGIIADIQYADIENGQNYAKTKMRYYRNSLQLLQSAIEEWKKEVCCPSFVIQLGDIIDGFNFQHKTSKISLKKVLQEIGKIEVPFHHIWGNHEFYNFDRLFLTNSELNTTYLEDKTIQVSSSAGIGSPEDVDPQQFYAYHFSPFSKFRFILIDAYDLSILGRDLSSRKYKESLKLLRKNNPNENLNSPTGLAEKQFVQFNGGFSWEQLHWLQRVLTFSDENKEKVVVIGHLPLHPDAADPVCLAWNYKDALAVLQSHKCVVCYLAGHEHDGGYCLDSYGIHHVTLEGIIETPPNSHAFATVYVYDDRMVLHGRGRVSSRVMHYRKDSKV
nr:manganese-dependent ADP-ribose/CDP-alcohol diphosphatase isoform X2 [Geotrypetes seraphini]XP_033815787.1 manganese-dependent ADP-ribose/CDP-alcohol diphosphatase isoform X2 [Geotrypetes seraphini]XP_033815788.1 manganese-dependent ADP-ribose/CDP-alcohol diphosphatase isoform X2 [Geotrypetes seraphini]XP_033815789.1 manganese-dependent ADP-ribose/CDP-alcohol diphosphatase isoform X2 [Geotrypetes seraphini]XP_033815791.1 manganese-dependent ADP-ribose/CDP-alcohol diphosphatase isoform X2 [Geo